jgi:hypothetical protein
MADRNDKKTTPPPPMVSAADDLLRYADQLGSIAQQLLTRRGELVEVALEMKRASR